MNKNDREQIKDVKYMIGMQTAIIYWSLAMVILATYIIVKMM